MNTNKINPVYQPNEKTDGQPLSAVEWNEISNAVNESHLKINSIIDDIKVLHTVILDGNDTLASQLTSTDTVYIIRTVFDLSNTNVTIPNNCTLKFEKGSIINGNIVFQNTMLEGDVDFINVTIDGSCANNILTPQMFGAKPSLTENENNKTQHTLGFQNLARVINNSNTLSKVIYISTGHYAINKPILITTSCTIKGDGNLSVIDCYEGKGNLSFNWDAAENEPINVFERLEGCTIAQDVQAKSKSIELTDASNINPGDYLVICDSVDGSFEESRLYYRSGELVKVESVNDNTITIFNGLYSDYKAETGESVYDETLERNVTVFSDGRCTMNDAPLDRIIITKANLKTYNISDLKIYGHPHENPAQGLTYYAFAVLGFANSSFERLTVESWGHPVAAHVGVGTDFHIYNCTFKTKRPRNYYTADAYGIVIGNSQRFHVLDCIVEGGSHALATSTGSSLNTIVNRDFIYENIHPDSNQAGSYIAIDIHGNAERYKLVNIFAPHTSCDMGGYNMIVEGCTFNNITPTFNCGGFIIRNCEIMNPGDKLLMTFAQSHISRAFGSIVVESSIIHGHITFNFQATTIFKNFIWKNNISDGLFMRSGDVDNIVIEGNTFNSGDVHILIGTKFVSFKNNYINDGLVAYLPSMSVRPGLNIAEGIFSGNTINFNGESPFMDSGTGKDYTIYLSKFKGKFINNLVKCEKDQVIMLIYNYSHVEVINNTIEGGSYSSDRLMQSAIVALNEDSHIKFNNNKHNSVYGNAVRISTGDLFSTTKQDEYEQFVQNDITRLNVIDSIGETTYQKEINKFGYVSTCPSTYDPIQQFTPSSEGEIVENFLEQGKTYFVDFRYNRGTHRIYFLKTNEFVEEDALLAVKVYMVSNAVFKAPDPLEYPYMFLITDGAVPFLFYLNRNVSETDGAVLNVKRYGNTLARPTYEDTYKGFRYFDTNLKKPIYIKDNDRESAMWAESDGATAGVIRIGTTSQRPRGRDIYVGFEYFDTDLNREIYAINIDGDTVTWKDTDRKHKYERVEAPYSFADITEVDQLGDTIYERNANKLGYASTGRKGSSLLTCMANKTTSPLENNIFTKDKLYFVTFHRTGYQINIFFSKTQEHNDEDLLLVFSQRYSNNGTFKAPDPNVYPYVYITSQDNSNVYLNFYENRNASEYDGAAYGIKRADLTANRPNGFDIYIGFVYFDTTLNKPIWAKAINSDTGVVTWVDATGTTI